MSMDTHRSTDHDEDRSTDYSRHRSTSSAESTAKCSAVRIMTHEEFTEKHPHPPSPFYVKIDRPLELAVDRQREIDIDRPPSPPIDRRAPLTYRVRLPSIDNDRINAFRPPPKQSANPPELTTNPSDTTPEPMQVDEATEGRRLRKRKEMDGFTKRVLRISVEKPFDEVYFTHRLWMFFRETKETEEDIWRMFHHVRERMKLRITLKKKSDPGKFAIPCVVQDVHYDLVRVVRQQVNLVELGNDIGYIAACHRGAEYETEYSKSIDTHTVSSIDSNESPTTDVRYPTLLDGKQPVDHFTLPDQSQERLGDELKTLVDDTYHPLDRGYNELFRSMVGMRTEIESMQHSIEKDATTSLSIDADKATSIDVKPQTLRAIRIPFVLFYICVVRIHHYNLRSGI
ncbi:hypothetical protein DY000_02021631 [Brassica cretica]|uniref:Uncharacterized protein n=1 Tax=Brassica cretica TaxID=69181 RepID=A0ABQ7E8I9_BRACR|nr:hypothetical protein DY000_02021631 [Brassica cretica]